MKLFLFDIDGTLLIGKSDLYRDPLNRAGREEFDSRFSVDLTDRLGSLDAHIIDEALAALGMTIPDGRLAGFKNRYYRYLFEAAPSATLLPGAAELLEALESRDDAALGLVTGNYREAARIKLNALGLDFDRFLVGGFGDKKTTRAELVRRAIFSARDFLGAAIAPEAVFVVGDTLKDIECARANGCRAVAVASGWTSREELAKAGPDLLLDSLEQKERFFKFCFDT